MPDDSETEGELLNKARVGNQTAFNQLRARLEPDVLRFIRRLIGRTMTEEDTVQAAFIALFQNRDRVEPEFLRPFVFRVVRNLVYNELRRQGRWDIVSLASEEGVAESDRLHSPNPAPDEEVFWILAVSEIQQVMERLPEAQRQTMILYAEEGFTYAQVAHTMATDMGTVKSRLHQARRNLQRQLHPDLLEAMGLQ